ncbi:MAG: gamma-glutamyl-gamma-aminobutyrate hydrolase family protein [Bryobacterales bacterium]|nr:gamma-glutamyl-gamma-aminobutyrate hydrolase family protein [Bryobacteraceae bacterium]MDW8353126.1 gamma-glutamyl-gamma-aminobutyrate hydrolase family protein [Bryobacterales bacterium]
MHVLAFRHVPFEHLGRIGPALEAAGLSWEYVDLFDDPWRPLPQADALIFMGGPMSANDDLPFLRRELELIQDALAKGRPVLGVCLGAQLLAKALGARVYRNPVKEIGWYPVFWTEAAQRDPLLHDLRSPETVFHWHGETFDLPEAAEWLAWSEACRHQAFRATPGVYGFQFHLEVTPEMIAGWLEEDANAGDLREIQHPVDPAYNAARLQELAARVFGRWARGVAEGAFATG